jgi:hypothetical protein
MEKHQDLIKASVSTWLTACILFLNFSTCAYEWSRPKVLTIDIQIGMEIRELI